MLRSNPPSIGTMAAALLTALPLMTISASATAMADGPEPSRPAIETITIATTDVPPKWALYERHVLDQLARGRSGIREQVHASRRIHHLAR